MNKKSFWKGFWIGCLICAISLGFIYYKLKVQPDISLNQIEVYSLNGEKDDLNKYVGKPMVVNFWATWCAPCMKEMPNLEKTKKELGDKVNFVLISDETPDKIESFTKRKSYTFTFLRSIKSFKEYGIISRPTTYFFNAKGQLITKHTGSLEPEQLNELIKQIQ